MKVGEGKMPAPSHGPDPRKDLLKSVDHFRQYLEDYNHASSQSEKNLAKDRMESELSIMDVAAENLRKEPRVQEQKVSKDFRIFSQNPSENNAAVLEHDLNTLKESLEP